MAGYFVTAEGNCSAARALSRLTILRPACDRIGDVALQAPGRFRDGFCSQFWRLFANEDVLSRP